MARAALVVKTRRRYNLAPPDVASTTHRNFRPKAGIAQLVERHIRNVEVRGSIPRTGTICPLRIRYLKTGDSA